MTKPSKLGFASAFWQGWSGARDPDESLSRAQADVLAENARLKAVLDGQIKDIRLVDVSIKPGDFAVTLKTGLGAVIAEWMLQAIEAEGARSYVEIEAWHPEAGKLSFQLMRMGGESPGRRAARYEELLRGFIVPQPFEKWHEAIGPVLWWRFPIVEPPYVGTPYDSTWSGDHTHWTCLPSPRSPAIAPATHRTCPQPARQDCAWPTCDCINGAPED